MITEQDVAFLIPELVKYGDRFIITCDPSNTSHYNASVVICESLRRISKEVVILTDFYRGDACFFKTYDVCIVVDYLTGVNFITGSMSLFYLFHDDLSDDSSSRNSHNEFYKVCLLDRSITRVSNNVCTPEGHEQIASREIRVKELFPSIADLIGRDDTLLYYVGPANEFHFLFRDFSQDLHNLTSKYFENVILINYDETLQEELILRAHRLARLYRSRINRGVNIFYLTGCIGGDEVYKEYCLRNGLFKQMQILSSASFESCLKSQSSMLDLNLIHYRVEQKSKKFLFFNRVPRTHRVVFMSHLVSSGLVDKGFCSFDIDEQTIDNVRAVMLKGTHADYMHDLHTLQQNMHRFPMKLNRSPERDNPLDIIPDDLKYFHDSYFSVVGETTFYTDQLNESLGGLFLSEKTFKPILCKHPFLVIGNPGILKFLRSFGYRTFDGIFDESYDQELDDNNRFSMIVQEVHRLCNLSDQEWFELMPKIKHIVEHNQQVLFQEKNLERDCYE